MGQWYKKLKIKTRIIIIYITILILSFVLTFSTISIINRRYTEREIGDAGIQTVNALAGNLSFIFDNVTQFSRLIYFDDNIQKSLDGITSDNIDPYIQQNITKSLVNMILSGDYISSVFIFDKFDNYYNSYKMGQIQVDADRVRNTQWYSQMKQAGGNGFFIHGSEGVLKFSSRDDSSYISYIREIGNKETYEPIAILLVTIEAETIQKYFEEVSGTYDSQFFIVDGEGNYIIPPNEYEEEYRSYIRNEGTDTQIKKEMINDSRVIMISQSLDIQDWRLIGSFQNSDIDAMGPYYTTVIIIIMCLNIIFVFLCSVLLTKLIFAPLAKVENHMKLVETGIFTEMTITGDNNEIDSLKRVFNHMTKSIQELIQKVVEEEKIIAKGELDLIQAQINPHFLYNTLDAVSALALIKDNTNCFKMTQALGSFYRNSLNSGMDFISVADELQGIDSYLTILNIRYSNKIKMEYDIEENIKEFYILKLLLQPLIENAVHHGIKEKGGEGSISIKGYQDEKELIFIVTDNGAGMDEDRIEEVLRGKAKTGKSGFGIYSLIQRIHLYYNIPDAISIHSEEGSGTEIAVRVCVRSEGDIC